MKLMRTLIFTLLLIIICLLNSVAQDPSQWRLPEDAKARIGRGHITDIKYSPDGSQMAVSSSIGVWLYDVHTGNELALLTGHTKPVSSVAYTPDGGTLISTGYDETIHFWDPHTHEHKAFITGDMSRAALSPDGRTLASTSYDIQLWDVDTLKQRARLTGHSGTTTSLAFSPDSTTLASANADETIRLWDVQTGSHKTTLTGHTDVVNSVVYSPDGTMLVSGSWDKTVRVWDAHTGEQKDTLIGHTEPISSVAFSPDGETLAGACTDRTIRLWDVETGELKATLSGHRDLIRVLAFSPDGKMLTSGSRDGTIQAWDPKTGQHQATWIHTRLVSTRRTLSPDGKTFATRDDKEIQLWDVNTGKLKTTLIGHTERVFTLTFSRDGSTLSSMSHKEVILWDTRTTKRITTLTDAVGEVFSSASTNVYSRALSADDGMLAVGKGNGTVELWDIPTGKHRVTFTKDTKPVYAIAFSPDGTTLASGSGDGTIQLWDIVNKKHKTTFTKQAYQLRVLVFSPDGATLAIGNSLGKIDLLHLDTGTYTSTLGHQSQEGGHSVNALAFSADGTIIASGGSDSTIPLWDAITGEYRGTLIGHTSGVAALAFSNTDATLVSSSEDGTVLLWEPVPAVDTDSLIRITPSPVMSPVVGEHLTFNINITGGKNIAGYQLSLTFDTTTLQYVSSKNGTYLHDDASFAAKVSKIMKIGDFHKASDPSRVELVSTTSTGFSDGNGTLATVTFEVIKAKASTISLPKARLEKRNGSFARPIVVNGFVVEPRQTPHAGKDYTRFVLPEGATARLGKGTVNDIKYSPDKTLLAVAGSIGIWLYDAHTGDELALLTGHTKPVTSIAFSPYGDRLVSGSYDGTLRLWNPHTGGLLKTLNANGRIATVAFSPNGRTLANGNGANIQLWDVNTGQYKTTISRGGSSIFYVVFSPDGQTLASASLSDNIQLWDPHTGQHIITFDKEKYGYTTSIRFSPSGPRLTFSPDGKVLASTAVDNMRGIDEKVKLWNTGTGELLATLVENETRGTYPVSIVKFSSDGTTLISGSKDGTLRMWDLATGENKMPFGKTEYGKFLLLPVLPNSDTLASVTPDNTVHLWDTKTGETRLTLIGHTTAIAAVALSVDGTTLASASDYHSTIQLWNLQTRRRKAILEGHESPISSMSFMPDGLTLASRARRAIFLWDVQTQQHKATFNDNYRGVFASSPDGRTIVRTGSHSIRLLDAHTGAHKMTLWGHTGYVTSVAFSPDSITLASGSEPHESSENPGAMVRLWNTKTGNQRLAFIADEHKISSVAFSTDGETLVSTSGPIIRLWEVKTGKRKATFTTYPDDARHSVYTRVVVFSPDGRTFASGDEGEMHSRENYNLIHIWEVETGKHLDTLTGHIGGVKSLAYSADGTMLVSGSLDGTMLLWKLASSPAARVSISPRAIETPRIGEKLTFDLGITEGQNLTGYQLTLQHDATALRYVSASNGDYLKGDVHVTPPVVDENSVTLVGSSDDGVRIGDGVLATVTFEVLARNASVLKLSDVILSDAQGKRASPIVRHGWVVEPPRIPEDVNHDWHLDAADLEAVSSRLGQTGKGNNADVNSDGIVDIADLVLVTKALSISTSAPHKD